MILGLKTKMFANKKKTIILILSIKLFINHFMNTNDALGYVFLAFFIFSAIIVVLATIQEHKQAKKIVL